MKSVYGLLLLLITTYGYFGSVQAQDQSGFISVSCGLVPKNTTYEEKTTNIVYQSDENYIDSGLPGKINDAYKLGKLQQLWTLRSFPQGERNCYSFNLTVKTRYLIRGTFLYGNYDTLNKLPSFDLHIGPTKWTSVSIRNVTNSSYREIIHVAIQDRLQVCLVKTGDTTPFISSLEIRPLHNETYETQSGSLMTLNRVYFTSAGPVIRYHEDIRDRIWRPAFGTKIASISTDLSVNTSSSNYEVPQPVAKTAIVPENASEPMNLSWTLDDVNAEVYIYLHFAEIQNLKDDECECWISHNQICKDLNGGL